MGFPLDVDYLMQQPQERQRKQLSSNRVSVYIPESADLPEAMLDALVFFILNTNLLAAKNAGNNKCLFYLLGTRRGSDTIFSFPSCTLP